MHFDRHVFQHFTDADHNISAEHTLILAYLFCLLIFTFILTRSHCVCVCVCVCVCFDRALVTVVMWQEWLTQISVCVYVSRLAVLHLLCFKAVLYSDVDVMWNVLDPSVYLLEITLFLAT